MVTLDDCGRVYPPTASFHLPPMHTTATTQHTPPPVHAAAGAAAPAGPAGGGRQGGQREHVRGCGGGQTAGGAAGQQHRCVVWGTGEIRGSVGSCGRAVRYGGATTEEHASRASCSPACPPAWPGHTNWHMRPPTLPHPYARTHRRQRACVRMRVHHHRHPPHRRAAGGARPSRWRASWALARTTCATPASTRSRAL